MCACNIHQCCDLHCCSRLIPVYLSVLFKDGPAVLTAFRLNLHSGTRAERSGGLMWCPSVRHLIICLLLSSRVALLDNSTTFVFWFILLCSALIGPSACLSDPDVSHHLERLVARCAVFMAAVAFLRWCMHSYCSESCEWGHASVNGGCLTVCYITIYTVHFIELLILYAQYRTLNISVWFLDCGTFCLPYYT